MACEEEIDGIWRVQWSETPVGNMDLQPCPMTEGRTDGIYCTA